MVSIITQKEALQEGKENLESVGIDLKQLCIKAGMTREEIEKEMKKDDSDE